MTKFKMVKKIRSIQLNQKMEKRLKKLQVERKEADQEKAKKKLLSRLLQKRGQGEDLEKRL